MENIYIFETIVKGNNVRVAQKLIVILHLLPLKPKH
jgi:hypothetical protein